jgi:hypothetical protein
MDARFAKHRLHVAPHRFNAEAQCLRHRPESASSKKKVEDLLFTSRQDRRGVKSNRGCLLHEIPRLRLEGGGDPSHSLFDFKKADSPFPATPAPS